MADTGATVVIPATAILGIVRERNHEKICTVGNFNGLRFRAHGISGL